jgi:hypothetical protein
MDLSSIAVASIQAEYKQHKITLYTKRTSFTLNQITRGDAYALDQSQGNMNSFLLKVSFLYTYSNFPHVWPSPFHLFI